MEPRTSQLPPYCVRSVCGDPGRWPFRRCIPVAVYSSLRSCIRAAVPARCMPSRTTAASRKRASRANPATRCYHHRCCHLVAAAAASSCAIASPASLAVASRSSPPTARRSSCYAASDAGSSACLPSSVA